MSYDLNVQSSNCDHSQICERYIVDRTDFRTLRLASNSSQAMRAPINGRQLVRVYVAGTLVQANDPVYGYTFEVDTDRVYSQRFSPDDLFLKIRFKRSVRLVVSLIEVSYTTLQPYCLKCSSYGRINDLKRAKSGSIQHITGIEKLAQRSMKYVLTSKCPFYPQLTCGLRDHVGKKYGAMLTDLDIANEVATSLQLLRQVQAAQQTVQNLDPNEVLKDIASVDAVQDTNDPTVMRVAIAVSSYGNMITSPLSFTLKTSGSTFIQSQFNPIENS